MQKKIKILTISDHPLSPSGVAHQTKSMIEGLLKTYPGKYEFICMGGAIKHEKYQPVTVDEQIHGKAWTIIPVNGYGAPGEIRSILRTHRPDVLWFMTDPRFFPWLWNMDNEIRSLIPMIYYHVWDNYPAPMFNKKWYDGNDKIVTISKVTSDIVKTVAPATDEEYLPHAVDPEVFKKISTDELERCREILYSKYPQNDGKFMFFWNNRNARRKLSGSLVWWFKQFLDEVGHDKAFLLMHTEPRDPHGQPLDHLISEWGLNDGQVSLSSVKLPPEGLVQLYNMADCTLNIADAEGFGLSSLESLSCEVPVINTMTGGLQEQVTDGKNWFGVGIEPASKAIIGSLQVPYIYEDRVSGVDVIAAMKKIWSMKASDRKKMGSQGRAYVLQNYSHAAYISKWDSVFSRAIEEYGSWENRKNYQSWRMEEVV